MRKKLVMAMAALFVAINFGMVQAATPKDLMEKPIPVSVVAERFFVVVVQDENAYMNMETDHVKYISASKIKKYDFKEDGSVTLKTQKGELKLAQTSNKNVFWALGKAPASLDVLYQSVVSPDYSRYNLSAPELVIVDDVKKIPYQEFENRIFLAVEDVDTVHQSYNSWNGYTVESKDGMAKVSFDVSKEKDGRYILNNINKTYLNEHRSVGEGWSSSTSYGDSTPDGMTEFVPDGVSESVSTGTSHSMANFNMQQNYHATEPTFCECGAMKKIHKDHEHKDSSDTTTTQEDPTEK